MREHNHPDDNMRWVRRGTALVLLLIGWGFILFTNNFHITPPVVFVCLGYFAGVAAIYTLYRLGATAVTANDETDDDQSWGRPLGALGELEREKRTLLKAIKEAEFDQQMGKLSKADAESMIAIYRARAIEVIKEIDLQSSGQAGSVRDRILREARARIQIEAQAQEAAAAPAKKKGKKGADKQQQRADKLADAVTAAKAEGSEAKGADADDKADDAAAKAEATDAKVEAKAEAADAKAEAADAADAKADAKVDAKADAKAEVADAKAADAKVDAKADAADAKAEVAGGASKSDHPETDGAAAKSDKPDISNAVAKSDQAGAPAATSDAQPEPESKEAAR